MNEKKPFLKWAGGKAKLAAVIADRAGPGCRLVEPFVGSGAVFMGTSYDKYLLCDSNEDLIDLFLYVKNEFYEFLQICDELFHGGNNNEESYYALRDEFNSSVKSVRKSGIFLYLNRHGFNGLCRYNKSGKFNVPFGRYTAPQLPREALKRFMVRSSLADFQVSDFRNIFKSVSGGDVVYCDPPYVGLSDSANFTSYDQASFTLQDQKDLADIAERTSREKNVRVVISNHDTPFTREIYSKASLFDLAVRRNISSKASTRSVVREIMAVYG